MLPSVSVIIVNYNGLKYLDRCLNSLLDNRYPKLQIILVDNASADCSVDHVSKKFPKVKIIRSTTNLGFAGGNNLGIKHAKGKYVLLLNNDTEVEGDFVKNLVSAFDELPNLGCVQPKIVLMREKTKIDSCGTFLTDSMLLYHYGLNKDQSLKTYNRPFPVFSVKGAAMLIRKDLIDKIGLFDEDFWSYYEETDFCHRAWLAGYQTWYFPKAKVYHLVGGTSTLFDNDFVQYRNARNRLSSFIKNFETATLLKVIPVYLFSNFIASLIWLFMGKTKHFLGLHRAIYWNITHLKEVLRKRGKVQKLRVLADKEIFKKVRLNPRLSYYYHVYFGIEKYCDEAVQA